MKTTPCTENTEVSPRQYSFQNAPRCGANARQGTPCQSPAIRKKKRCRMHGGKGSGAPLGNENALTHGLHTVEARNERRVIKHLFKQFEDLKNTLRD